MFRKIKEPENIDALEYLMLEDGRECRAKKEQADTARWERLSGLPFLVPRSCGNLQWSSDNLNKSDESEAVIATNSKQKTTETGTRAETITGTTTIIATTNPVKIDLVSVTIVQTANTTRTITITATRHQAPTAEGDIATTIETTAANAITWCDEKITTAAMTKGKEDVTTTEINAQTSATTTSKWRHAKRVNWRNASSNRPSEWSRLLT